jgi:hypothetical protein
MRPPLWARWVLSLGVAIVALVALIVFVDRHNNDNLATQSPKALARANREAEIVVSQDQAPHVVNLRSVGHPRSAFTHAVRADISSRIAKGIIDGNLDGVRCSGNGRRGDTLSFNCIATADQVNYQYVGVIHRSDRQLVYCKRDAPPVPSMNIPISARCQL